MKLKDLCVLDVATCHRSQSVAAAAKLMREKHIGALVVIDDDDDDQGMEPVGMITDRDIVVEVISHGLDPTKTPVMTVMSRRIIVASESEDVMEALDRMASQGVRRLPVVNDEGCLTGLIALDDLLRLHARQTARLLDVLTAERNREVRNRR